MTESETQSALTIERQQQELAALQDLQAEQFTELTQVEAQFLEQERELVRTRSELDRALRDLEQLKLSSTTLSETQQVEIARLTESESQSALTIERQQQELASLQALYAERLTELNQIEENFLNRERELARTKSRLDEVLSQLQQVKITSAALSETQQADIARLTESETQSALTIERQQQELASLQALYGERLLELNRVEAEFIERDRDLVRTQSELKTALEELQKVQLASATLSESQKADIARLTESESQSAQTIESQKQELVALQALYTERLAELGRIESEFIENERSLARLQEQMVSAVEMISSLRLDLQERNETINSLNAEVASLSDEVSALSSTSDESKSHIDQLLTEKLQDRNRIAQQQLQLVDFERTVQQITIENEELLRELDFSRRLQADRQQQFETLQSVMAQLSADLKTRDEKIESLQTEKEELFQTGVKSDHEVAELREAYQQRLTELVNL
ncbi:MAG: hypothetical protein MJE68_33445, partial [Proteobacteria bacterium]|nr:hypothetical protein [Pseudomonadota bacterium]